MISLRAAYFTDEVNRMLLKMVDPEYVKDLLGNLSGFTIKNGPVSINQDTLPPLYKVAWNILNRGQHTRASLKVSTYLLQSVFGDQVNFDYSQPEITTALPPLDDISKGELEDLLQKLHLLTEEQASQYGETGFRLYRYYKKSVGFAQLQKTMMLCLMADPRPTEFSISGIPEEEAVLLIEDLNDVFNHLNNLVSKTETPFDPIGKNEANHVVHIDVSKENENAIHLLPHLDRNKEIFFTVLTDRKITYRPLGKVIEEEVESPEGNREIQRFEYKTQKQQKALEYFLQNLFRKSGFRPGQEGIINRALPGKDVIGLLPTGGGKSLTFQLCALLHPGVTIVVDPINSLMKDQFDKLRENGITRASYINSSDDKDSRDAKMQKLHQGEFQLMFVSPERFQMQNFRSALSQCKNTGVYFSYAVIDEAHCVSEWGHDFRHVYLNLAQNLRRHCPVKSDELTFFGLTATASFDVLADVQRELDLNDEAIVTLPAEAIDRKELNFNIIHVDHEVEEGLIFYERENQTAAAKYPMLHQFLKNLPSEIKTLERNYGYISDSPDLYEDNEDGYYENAGVIFCPTKSNRMPNGVLHLRDGSSAFDGLSKLPFLEISTFFGAGGDDDIRNNKVETEAAQSLKNQHNFIRNKANLMLATKAFGMGIDKPNIRYSIHYSFPNSVESFYQEAGRAGRDRKPALCSILYHPVDEEMNLDFFRNGFKGTEREKEIIDELLTEVRYEDRFFLKVFGGIIKEKFPKVASVGMARTGASKDRYIYINGPYSKIPENRIKIGLLDLERDLRSYDNATQNFDTAEAHKILEFARGVLKEYCPDGEYLKWINTKSADGIKTLMEANRTTTHRLIIGFNNDIVSKMTETISAAGYKDFTEHIIMAAYNFSQHPDEFLDNLYSKYKSAVYNGDVKEGPEDLHLSLHTQNFLKNNYHRIRNMGDTQRAIYRLNLLGIIDDYVIDYAGKSIEVRFKKKTRREYLKNFEKYLRRYLGIETTNKWLSKARETEADSIMEQVMYTLIEFIENEISKKRERSINYMKKLCEVYLENGEREFRDRMIRYFTSKYARTDYLPADTDNGRKENCEIVRKYIHYIDNPPDGLGGQIDNAKHLRGACDNLRINMKDNASVDLLTSFSLMALELKEDDTLESAQEKPMVAQAIKLYRNGFRRMLRIDDWDDVLDTIALFNTKVKDFNTEIAPLLDTLSAELLINRTNFKLNELLEKITA